VEAPTFENEYEKQIEEVQKKMPVKSFTEFLMNSKNTWELK
jgi:2-oxoglutarate ferredoxin oxidoreductase subunit beta